jgi:hypothetical protein
VVVAEFGLKKLAPTDTELAGMVRATGVELLYIEVYVAAVVNPDALSFLAPLAQVTTIGSTLLSVADKEKVTGKEPPTMVEAADGVYVRVP